MLSENSIVRSLKDVPENDIEKGDIGTIVHCYVKPREGYEIEFLDKDGYTKAVLTYERRELEPLENQEAI